MNEPIKHHIFLSYSRRDADIMHRVRDTLSDDGLTVWTDEGIEPGTPLWDRAVEDGLKSAGCMVVILSMVCPIQQSPTKVQECTERLLPDHPAVIWRGQ
jgi:hypothetical protein